MKIRAHLLNYKHAQAKGRPFYLNLFYLLLGVQGIFVILSFRPKLYCWCINFFFLGLNAFVGIYLEVPLVISFRFCS